MKVLHYVPNFSVTTETFIYDQVLSIQSLGVESSVLTTKRLNIDSRPFSKVYVSPFKNIYNDRVTQSLALRFQLMPLLIDYKYWRKVLEDFQPDVIHCHTGNAVKTWMHVSEKIGITLPTIASMHGSDVNSEPLVRKKYKKTLSIAGSKPFVHWTVPSNFLKYKTTLNLSVPENKISVVYNAVNPAFIGSLEPISFEQLRLISIGRFITCKGQVYLIRAFSQIIKIYPNARLTLVGVGPLKQALVDFAHELGIYKSIKFLDSVEHTDLPRLLSEHNIYVQPSIKDENTMQEESFGVAALEAMAMGLSIIVTECGGLKELALFCDRNCASVVPQKSENDIVTAVVKHFSERTASSLQCRETIGNVFSNEKNAINIVNIYKSMIEKVKTFDEKY
ncbi:glycosyltransferase family 4 protein [Pseudoalteromonas issachenkonii]|uniref:Glycosyltransferase family 4 protein n=1 Tax=Pseudoalteromonas issachenkonii TaxID=152297 RepID=A0ABU9GZ34_9GAMM